MIGSYSFSPKNHTFENHDTEILQCLLHFDTNQNSFYCNFGNLCHFLWVKMARKTCQKSVVQKMFLMLFDKTWCSDTCWMFCRLSDFSLPWDLSFSIVAVKFVVLCLSVTVLCCVQMNKDTPTATCYNLSPSPISSTKLQWLYWTFLKLYENSANFHRASNRIWVIS
jgi:hypothetical protein